MDAALMEVHRLPKDLRFFPSKTSVDNGVESKRWQVKTKDTKYATETMEPCPKYNNERCVLYNRSNKIRECKELRGIWPTDEVLGAHFMKNVFKVFLFTRRDKLTTRTY